MKILSKLLLSATLLISANAAFTPKIPQSEANGVKLYLLPTDGKANTDGSIDQFWLVELINKGQVPSGIHLVDVREAVKYNAEHLKDAISAPGSKDDTIDESLLPEDGVIVFYCNTGMKSINIRSTMEDEKLLKRVFTLDATYECDKQNKNCKLTPNEAIE